MSTCYVASTTVDTAVIKLKALTNTIITTNAGSLRETLSSKPLFLRYPVQKTAWEHWTAPTNPKIGGGKKLASEKKAK